MLVTTLRLETTNALTVRIPTLCHNRSDLSTFIATCGQWTDWEKSPDSPYTNIRTRECTEECDEGQINLRFDCHLAEFIYFLLFRPLESVERLELLQSLVWWLPLQVPPLC